MNIATHRTYRDSPPDYRKAVHRMSGRRPTIANFARWLFNFTCRDIGSLSRKDSQKLQWDGFVFVHREGFPEYMGATQPLPSQSELIGMQDWIRTVWDGLKNDRMGRMVWIDFPNGTHFLAELYLKNDGIYGGATPRMSSWSDQFKYSVYETLTATDVASRFRFCKSDQCRRPFLSIKRQVYCSPSCSQHHRTSVYRKNNRERFKARRREYYARKQKERTGHDLLRIQSRRR